MTFPADNEGYKYFTLWPNAFDIKSCYLNCLGIVSGAVLQLKEDFQLDCQQQEMVVSSMLFGALLGSLAGG